MPGTALYHFNQDATRARAIIAHADPLPRTNVAEQVLRSDLLRSAWMFAVGAIDAYFCDAYTDIVAARKRLFGITRAAFSGLAPNQRGQAIEDAKGQMEERYRYLFQRRHDCIHNCDRPKVSPQALHLGGTVLKVIQDAEFLVHRCDEHIRAEFREFLLGTGCPAAIVDQTGYRIV